MSDVKPTLNSSTRTSPSTPFPVWVVSLVQLWSMSYTGFWFYMGLTGQLNDAEGAAMIAKMTWIDLLFVAINIGLNAISAILFFRLDRRAVRAYQAVLAFNILTNIWFFFIGDIEGVSIGSVGAGTMILAFIVLYARKLEADGVLRTH